jgi:hypothetical protein
MTPGYLLRKPSPWLTFDAIRYIDKQPLEGRKIFEYGSGGSTLYWVSRGAECVSIEHDAHWYETLRPMLPSTTGVDYRLVPPTPLESGDDGSPEGDDPRSYLSSYEQYRGYSFRAYASQIDDFPQEHFDLVLIDGRARPSCIRHAVLKIKPGGMLVVDNSNRPRYLRRTGNDLKAFRRLSFYGVGPSSAQCWQTDIFVKDQ